MSHALLAGEVADAARDEGPACHGVAGDVAIGVTGPLQPARAVTSIIAIGTLSKVWLIKVILWRGTGHGHDTACRHKTGDDRGLRHQCPRRE